MNTDDLKYEFQDYWTRFLNWFDAFLFSVKGYFKTLDIYEYFGWGVIFIALILVVVAFV